MFLLKKISVLMACLIVTFVQARVTKIQIDQIQLFPNEMSGGVATEQIAGRAFGELDPRLIQNSVINDIQFVKDYIELEKLRLGDRADVHLEVNGSGFGVLIEPLLFINYIENAFKHGANPSIGKARIDINYTIDAAKQELHFKISNQIPKVLNTIEQQKVGGIGLKNVETRLNILYPGKHLLNIEQANQIYTVYLTLQLS